MSTYKAFWTDSRTNLVRSETIKASEDVQALALVGRVRRGVRQEVWQGDRYVGTIDISGTQNRLVAAKRILS